MCAHQVCAKIGDSCTFSGIEGTCQEVENCRNCRLLLAVLYYIQQGNLPSLQGSFSVVVCCPVETDGLLGAETYWAAFEIFLLTYVIAFTVNGACPKDFVNVKCCITKQCTDTAGKDSVCLNAATPINRCYGVFVMGRCPGASDVQGCVFDAPPSSSGTRAQFDVSFYTKSFIPLNFEDVTHPWPNHPSKTILNGHPRSLEWVPNLGGCFVTDQRGFSSLRDASARMHSEAYVKSNAITWDWSQLHRWIIFHHSKRTARSTEEVHSR